MVVFTIKTIIVQFFHLISLGFTRPLHLGIGHETEMAELDRRMLELEQIETALKAKQEHVVKYLDKCHDAYDKAMMDIANMDVSEFLREDVSDRIVELHVCIQKMKSYIEDAHTRLAEVTKARSANNAEQMAINAKRLALLNRQRKNFKLAA